MTSAQELGADHLAVRVIESVMRTLSHEPVWQNLFLRVAVRATLDRCVMSRIQAGETCEDALTSHALTAVRKSMR